MMKKAKLTKKIWQKLSSISLCLLFVWTINAPVVLAQADANKKAPPPPAMPKSIRKGSNKVSLVKPVQTTKSKVPTDLEIMTLRVFPEPLTPMSGKEVKGENADLVKALDAFKLKNNYEDISDLTSFLNKYPKSRWRPSLELNIALRRYEAGYFSDTLSRLTAAWQAAKNEKGQAQKAVADRAIGELINLEARLGRIDDIEKHLNEIKNRQLIGSVEMLVSGAREGFAKMKTAPQEAYKCGPYAVNTLLNLNLEIPKFHPLVEQMQSSAKGTSLAQVKDLADRCGLNYQMAKKTKGTPLIVPSIMHFKLGHFGAITNLNKNRYNVKDPTFDRQANIWVTAKALDSESDGYFLIPAGPLPTGWQTVSQQEAEGVWGRGGSPQCDPSKSPSDPQKCPKGDCCDSGGMATAKAFTMNATLKVMDTPLGYSPPIGPSMDFLINYNHLEAGQPATFTFTNLGPDWSLNWCSWVSLDASLNATVQVRGGGQEYYPFTQPNNSSNPYPPHLTSQAILSIDSVGVYRRTLPDGSYELFNQADGTGRYFMTQVVDSMGNKATVAYDGNFRLTSITDAISQATSITYLSNTVGNVGFYKISQISDPFSRTCSFSYDSTTTNLVSITDVIGLQSKFTYDLTNTFINSLTTPYGTTSFSQYTGSDATDIWRGLKFNFPDGTSSVIENWLRHETKTYFWSRQQLGLYPNDPANKVYTHCEMSKFMMSITTFFEMPVVALLKKPLESLVTYTYQGQSGGNDFIFVGINNDPIQITRTLDDNSVQNYFYEYNDFGMMTKSTDPVGRVFEYRYAANNIDMLEKRQTKSGANDLIGKWIFNNSQHLPNIAIDGSGQRTVYTYNAAGQPLTVTDSNNNVTTMTYNGNGYLTQINGPLPGNSDITTIAYDGYGRVYTVTDSVGYVITYSYDNFDRVTQVTYPDGTSEQNIYNKLDKVMSKDRNGRWTEMAFDNMQQMVYEKDPLGRKTQYFWCDCGSIEQLKDPANNTTSWDHDIQGRVTKKTYADATDVDYVYENTTSRLKNVTDALNQVKNYTYYLDNSLYQVSYSNAVNATSTVTMTYDANYPRLATAANGWGTYTYSYNNYITDPFAPIATVTMGGSNTTGDKVNITVTNSNLGGGKRNVQYTVQSGDTTSTLLATSVKNAINADGTLSAAGITATSSAAVISILGPVPLGVVTEASSTNGIVTQTIGGTITASDVVNITAIDAALPNGQKTKSYTVGGGDSTTTIATALKNAINADSDYTAAGITATSSAAVISISSTSSNATIYSQSVSAGATETITQGGGPTETATTAITTGAGMLSTVHNNVIANSDITYLYDALGRTINRSINGSSNSINWIYDQMSRVTQETNALGTFNYNYVDNTPGSSKGVTRLASINYPNGQTTRYDWFGNTGDQRLQQISNLNPSGATISQFSYRYNPAGEITQWQQLQNNTSLNYGLGYDLAGQLTSAQASGGPQSSNYQKQYYYAYDSASNRTGVQQSTVTKVKIGGSVTTSDVLTITVVDPGISGGSQAINYTVQGGDTLNSIATALAAAITANSNLQTLGVDASSNGSVISIKSASRDITTYTSSTSGGATETISLNVTDNFVENALIGGTKTTSDVLTIKFIDPALAGGSKSISYTVQAGDTLTTIATGIKNAVNADSALSTAGITSTSAGTVITIRSTSPNATTYSQSVSAGATETITLSVNQNANMIVAIGGTKTTSDVITLAVYDAQLPSGVKTKTYTVQAGDNLAAIATGVTTAINGDSDLQAAGITATSSGTIITIQSNSINPTTYRGSINTNGTETVSMGLPPNGVQTATIGGTKTTSDVLTVTVYDAGLSGGSKAINHTVLGGDTLTTIASGIASAINADSALTTQGITATSSSTVVNLKSTSVNATTYSKSLSGGATETITLAPATNVTAYAYNNVNELTSIAPGGAALFKGTANKALKSATVNSNPATLNYTEEFQGNATLSTGNNNIPVAVTDGANNTKTNNYQVVAGTGSSASPTFDANGNMTSDGTNTYAWDAENRLVRIDYSGIGNQSEFSFDCFGRNILLIEQNGGSLSSTKQFIWCGNRRVEERDASSVLKKQFFKRGEKILSVVSYFSKDHLGSIRELSSSNGSLQSQYLYTPFGDTSTISEMVVSDFKFTGYMDHVRSKLYLTRTRQYNRSIGRYISRDPIFERSGSNIFTYVLNDPINLKDPSGLMAVGRMGGGGTAPAPGAIGGAAAAGSGSAAGGGGKPPDPPDDKDPKDPEEEARRRKRCEEIAREMERRVADWHRRWLERFFHPVNPKDKNKPPKPIPIKKCDAKGRKGSVEGHDQPFQDIIDDLGDLRDEWDRLGCDGALPPGVTPIIENGVPGPQPVDQQWDDFIKGWGTGK